MKRLQIEEANLKPNFIGSWKMEASICDQIIVYYEQHKDDKSALMLSYELDWLKDKFKSTS